MKQMKQTWQAESVFSVKQYKMKISLVINCDNRIQNDQFTGSNLGGCVNEDFLIEGIVNKIKFFLGFDIQVIIYVDEHSPISEEMCKWWMDMCHVLVIRKHTHESHFNDYN